MKRPTYWKCSRRIGGFKLCSCGFKSPLVARVDGKTARLKTCHQCGRDLPRERSYPKKSAVTWYVREVFPNGHSNDYPADSSEAADELIAQKRRDWTEDPVQRDLLEYTSCLIRQIHAGDREAAIDELIVKLGGSTGNRGLVPIGWDEAVEQVATELQQTGKSALYAHQLRQLAAAFRTITRVEHWRDVTLETIIQYRAARMAGGWKRDDEAAPGVGPVRLNGDLAILSAFLSRAEKRRWISVNVLKGQSEKIKIPGRRVAYMPDAVLEAFIKAATPQWLKTLLVVAYYTGARRPDLVALEWARDVDLDGSRPDDFGVSGPKIWIEGAKADTPHWMPLPAAAAESLKKLRQEPVVSRHVFGQLARVLRPDESITKCWTRIRKTALSALPAELRCTPDGKPWLFKHLRKKANTDYRNHGASSKERMAFLGHRSESINERHYEGLEPARLRAIMDAMPAFGVA